MKRLTIALLACALVVTPVYADFDYSTLDGLSLEELKEIHTEIGNRITSMTAAPDSSGEETHYNSGQYKIGIDIPAGEYVLFPGQSGRTGYYFETRDANGNDYAGSGSFDHNEIVTIREGNYFRLDHAYAVPIEENPTVDVTVGGTFKVGLHIPAGEYKLSQEKSDRTAYYFIYTDSTKENYAGSGSFEGNSYVSVSDGQILRLDHAIIEW